MSGRNTETEKTIENHDNSVLIAQKKFRKSVKGILHENGSFGISEKKEIDPVWYTAKNWTQSGPR